MKKKRNKKIPAHKQKVTKLHPDIVSVPIPHVKTEEGSWHEAYLDVSLYTGMLATGNCNDDSV